MICEFFQFEEKIIVGNITGIQMAALPFSFGLFLIIYYYGSELIRKKT
jgi:hypothetical protein